MSDERDPMKADAPESGDSQPFSQEQPANIDWRIVTIIGLGLVLLIAVFVNKFYYGDTKPDEGTTTVETTDGNDVNPMTRRMTLAQGYKQQLGSRELEAASQLFLSGDKTFTLARQPRPVRRRDGRVGVDLAKLFDLSNMMDGVTPRQIHRRMKIAGNGLMNSDNVPVLSEIEVGVKAIYKSAADVTLDKLSDQERVIGVTVNNEARAYPVKMMNYHELANDVVGGVPIFVSWSAYADNASAMTRKPIKADGKPLIFCSAALMYQSCNVVYDLETRSLWWPMRHTVLAGELMGKQTQDAVPTVMTTWGAWRKLHPKTTVLVDIDVGNRPNLNIPYWKNMAVRENNDRLMLPMYPVYNFDIDKTPIAPNVRIIGVVGSDGKTAKAYIGGLLAALPEAERSFDDTIGDEKVRVTYDAESYTLLVKTADGKELPTKAAFWIAWAGAYPESSVFKDAEVRKQMDEFREQMEAAVEKANAELDALQAATQPDMENVPGP
jgi:Protein of unknown function (DUF3179)